jgi:DNA-binding NarL/FixJ family response regulator
MLERTRKTILIVDDSPIVLEMAGSALEAAGYKVVLRSRGEGTVAAVIQERPDLVLLDVNMPRLSGDTIAVILTKTDPGRKTIVLLHSSISPELLKLKVLQTGASGYLHKTSSAHDLVTQVNQWFKRSSGAYPLASQPTAAPIIASAEGAAADPSVSSMPPSSGGARPTVTEPKQPSGTFRRPPSVLFVDDDQFTLSAYRRLLSREPFNCDTAVTGEEALRKMSSKTPPDVVVCDLLMPRMDGVQLFNSAVEIDPSYRRRFVFATGASSVLYIRKFLDTVNCQVVHKPVDADILVRAIRLAAIAGGVFDTSAGAGRSNLDER